MAGLSEFAALTACHYDGQIVQFAPGSVLDGFRGEEEVFDCEKGAAAVHSVGILPCFHGQFPDVRMAGLVGDACIGTEDVDGSKVVLCFLQAGRDGVFV